MGRLFDVHQLLQHPADADGGCPSIHQFEPWEASQPLGTTKIGALRPESCLDGAFPQGRGRTATAFNGLDAGREFFGGSQPSRPSRPRPASSTWTMFSAADHEAEAPGGSGEAAADEHHHGTNDPHGHETPEGEHPPAAEEGPGFFSRMYGSIFGKPAKAVEDHHAHEHPEHHHDAGEAEQHLHHPETDHPDVGTVHALPALPEAWEKQGEDVLSEVELDLKNGALERIAKVNKRDLALYNKIMRHTAEVPGVRREMDKVMADHMVKVRSLCQQYMEDRARLRGPGGTRCVAVQGRVNAARLPHSGDREGEGLKGCLEQEPEGNGTGPLPLGTCSNGRRELGCMRRLNDLMQHRPAPGEKPGGPSMDKQVRQWCHYEWYMPAHPVSEELASGMPDPNGSEEFEDDDGADLAAEEAEAETA